MDINEKKDYYKHKVQNVINRLTNTSKEDELRYSAVDSLKRNVENSLKYIDEVFKKLDELNKKMKSLENEYTEKANELNFDKYKILRNKVLCEKNESFKIWIESIRDKIDELKNQIDDEQKVEKSLEMDTKLIEILNPKDKINEVLKQIEKFINKCRIECEKELISEIDFNIQKLIINEEKKAFCGKLKNKCNEKVGFIGRLLGKERLRQEQIENLELKIKILENKCPVQRTDCTIDDCLSDLYVCSFKVREGNFSGDMNAMYLAVKEIYENIDDEKIIEMANTKMKNENALIVLGSNTKVYDQENVENLTKDNLRLQNELMEIEQNNVEKDSEYKRNLKPFINEYWNKIVF